MINDRIILPLVVVAIGAGWYFNSGVNQPPSEPIATGSIQTNANQSPQADLVDSALNPFQVATPGEAITLANEPTVAKQANCEERCEDTLDAIIFPFAYLDDDYESALGDVDGIALRLQNNEQLREELLELALHTTGNKRKLIIAVFQQLDSEHRVALGTLLTESQDVHNRLDGIQLLSNADTMDKSLVPLVSNLLQFENNEYVRGAAIQSLNNPELFYADSDVLAVLQTVIESEPAGEVRGTALLASSRLIDNPEQLVYQSMLAVRSESDDYQQYGVKALEEIFTRQTLEGDDLSWQATTEMTRFMEEIMSPEHDDMPEDVRRELDNLAGRFL